MALKTFNVQEETYERFSRHCKEYGISMSKQIDTFMASVVEEDPKVKEEYLRRLDAIRAGRFMKVDTLAGRYRPKK